MDFRGKTDYLVNISGHFCVQIVVKDNSHEKWAFLVQCNLEVERRAVRSYPLTFELPSTLPEKQEYDA